MPTELFDEEIYMGSEVTWRFMDVSWKKLAELSATPQEFIQNVQQYRNAIITEAFESAKAWVQEWRNRTGNIRG